MKTIPFAQTYTYDESGNIYNKKGLLLGGTISSDGYRTVGLNLDSGKRKLFQHHRLVAELFHPNPEHLAHVDHIDEDRLNNHPDNLQWKSERDNGDKAKKYFIRETVTLISPSGEHILVDCAYSLAKQHEDLSEEGIRRLVRGTQVKHKGWTRASM